jgi:hypothetical protein
MLGRFRATKKYPIAGVCKYWTPDTDLPDPDGYNALRLHVRNILSFLY